MIKKFPKEIPERWSWFGWFASKSGRKFTLGCVTTLGIGTVSFNLLPQTFLLDDYRELFQLYRKNTPVRVPTTVRQRFDAVLRDLEAEPETRSALRPFMVAGFDMFHAGTTLAKSGAVVGIPITLTYNAVDDIDKSNLTVQSRKIDWEEGEDGRELLEALVLSEEAKRFAIAQETIRCRTAEPLLNGFYSAFGIALAYVVGSRMNLILNGFARPFAWRAVVYTLSCLFGYGNWAFVKDFTTIHYDNYCLEEACELGVDYVKGGQEFYDKTLKRNKCLRSLWGDYGARLYSSTGNEKFFIRQKRLSLASKKYYLDKRAENFN